MEAGRRRTMKILLAHKYFYRGGGTATYLFALIEELEKRGHQWVPFTVAYDQTEVHSYSEYFVSPPLGASQTHYSGMKFSPWAMLRLLGRATYSFEARRKALRLIDDTQPDVAYVHNIYNYISPSVLHAFHRRELPVVMRVADYNLVCPAHSLIRDGHVCTECLAGGYARALKHRCVKGSPAATAARVFSMYIHDLLHVYDCVDLFITPSAFLRQLMIGAGYDEGRVVHLPSFYPNQVQTEGRESEGAYVLYFGRISPEKGIDTLIRAMQLVDGDIRLVIAGIDVDGTQAELERLTSEPGLDGRVEFAGFQNREALDQLIAGCTFTVVPSRWYDNCPMAILESFGHGKPVVGSNIGGIPEQITDDCGLLVEPGNVIELAEKMQLLIADSELRKILGDGAQQRVVRDYSPERHCDRLLSLFEELVRCKTDLVR